MPASQPSRSGNPEDSFTQSLTAPHGLKEDSIRLALEDPHPPPPRIPTAEPQ